MLVIQYKIALHLSSVIMNSCDNHPLFHTSSLCQFCVFYCSLSSPFYIFLLVPSVLSLYPPLLLAWSPINSMRTARWLAVGQVSVTTPCSWLPGTLSLSGEQRTIWRQTRWQAILRDVSFGWLVANHRHLLWAPAIYYGGCLRDTAVGACEIPPCGPARFHRGRLDKAVVALGRTKGNWFVTPLSGNWLSVRLLLQRSRRRAALRRHDTAAGEHSILWLAKRPLRSNQVSRSLNQIYFFSSWCHWLPDSDFEYGMCILFRGDLGGWHDVERFAAPT